ncbi:MAG: hypothetical protein EXR77_05510 [Myxococcales bacterium]|nr:hypothetical protein [Myxococcales bacterium]
MSNLPGPIAKTSRPPVPALRTLSRAQVKLGIAVIAVVTGLAMFGAQVTVLAAQQSPIRCDNGTSRATGRAADLLDRGGEFAAAAEQFRQAYEQCPWKAGYLYRAGRALWMAGEQERALATWRRVLELSWAGKSLKFQAGLEISQLSAQRSTHRPALPERAVPSTVKPTPPPAVVKPSVPPAPLKPVPPPLAATPTVAPPKPVTEITAPAVPPPPDVPRILKIDTRPPDPQPELKPPPTAPEPERHTAAAVVAFVVAGVAMVAALYFASRATDRADALNSAKLPQSETFNLIRIDKSQAVIRSNAVVDWWNAALASGMLGATGITTGAWLISDPDPAGTAVRQSTGRSDGLD